MLQIIGWLLCVYLVVKGFELVAMKHVSAYIGACLAFIAAPLFFWMINEQVAAQQPGLSGLQSASSYSDEDADKALEEAGQAVENAARALEQGQ